MPPPSRVSRGGDYESSDVTVDAALAVALLIINCGAEDSQQIVRSLQTDSLNALNAAISSVLAGRKAPSS